MNKITTRGREIYVGGTLAAIVVDEAAADYLVAAANQNIDLLIEARNAATTALDMAGQAQRTLHHVIQRMGLR